MLLFIPFSVSAQETQNEYCEVYPGGEVFGIKMHTDGVLVIDTQEVMTEKGKLSPAAISDIVPGDIIVTANGQYIDNTKTLQKIISESQNNEIVIKIKRDGNYLTKSIKCVKDLGGIYRLGAWIKDSAAGLGTVSFYTSDGKYFSSLGHGIYDRDTKMLMPLSDGELFFANITSVTKSSDNKVGVLNGYFTDNMLGTAIKNCNNGIYCNTTNFRKEGSPIEIAPISEIKEGPAEIMSTISSDGVMKYSADIIDINKTCDEKNMIIEITDKELLERTGGIVQGMSGSPIIQNNKLVGILTHVCVDDVSKGYAIFAKTMYETLETCK